MSPRQRDPSRSPLVRYLVVGITCLYVFVGVFVLDSTILLDETSTDAASSAMRPAAHFVATHDDAASSSDPCVDTVAIVGYVPHSRPEYIAQVNHMLFASWNYTTHRVPIAQRNRTDLLLFAHWSVLDAMPSACTRLTNLSAPGLVTRMHEAPTDGCYVIEHSPPRNDFWNLNTFMHSLAFMTYDAYRPILTSYNRLMRTDVDCAITPAFLTYRPDHFVVGKGGYMFEQTKPELLQVASELQMTHQGLHNIGSTWFGNATLILDMMPRLLEVAKYILHHEVHRMDKGWPLWHIPVLSMYAGEITINHFIPKANLVINNATIDVNAIGDDDVASIYHIHCWPDAYREDQYFDKWAFKNGAYTAAKFPRPSLNISSVRDYMMAMVLYGE
ncbi:Aste57867_9289 [Aphanomyces stellatus]|uniref:Aste57867_9289 protein n=1 Tax=Aphanomyces stellatus TaxID=120398 RepID=A0A485KMK7_9STRA|nr:hypothetical protein As57867_009253 [Aphanomyces stellatus]VFT86171.1 Aste57867_9289 [Aphanomyces stellatus]